MKERISIYLVPGCGMNSLVLEKDSSDRAHQIGYAFEDGVLRAWNNTREGFSTSVFPIDRVIHVESTTYNDCEVS